MTKNSNGVYEPDSTETVARHGRSFAEVSIARCDDGLYRFALSVHYSYGGFAEPITDHGEGFRSYHQAHTAGIDKLLARFPKAFPSNPPSVHNELAAMKEQVRKHAEQPTLF